MTIIYLDFFSFHVMSTMAMKTITMTMTQPMVIPAIASGGRWVVGEETAQNVLYYNNVGMVDQNTYISLDEFLLLSHCFPSPV